MDFSSWSSIHMRRCTGLLFLIVVISPAYRLVSYLLLLVLSFVGLPLPCLKGERISKYASSVRHLNSNSYTQVLLAQFMEATLTSLHANSSIALSINVAGTHELVGVGTRTGN